MRGSLVGAEKAALSDAMPPTMMELVGSGWSFAMFKTVLSLIMPQ
jgi:hypothetical protein